MGRFWILDIIRKFHSQQSKALQSDLQKGAQQIKKRLKKAIWRWAFLVLLKLVLSLHLPLTFQGLEEIPTLPKFEEICLFSQVA